MNIIQIQDDLKGLPDQELISEVQNPSGVAPVYLLLGELQRREKMRAEFAGQQEPTQTVAEQIIEEAIAPAPPMPMEGSPIPPGPGQAIPPANEVVDVNRMNEVVTPQGAEMTDTNMLASRGVGALPAPNIGQYAEGGVIGFDYPEYAQGGVVGFAPGGQTRITDPGQEPERLGQGYWGMFGEHLKENVGPYWWQKLSPELRETIKDVPRVAGEQLEAVVESPIGQTVKDIPRVAGEQIEAVGEAVEAFPYPPGYESSAYDLTERGVADPRRTGVTGELYTDTKTADDMTLTERFRDLIGTEKNRALGIVGGSPSLVMAGGEREKLPEEGISSLVDVETPDQTSFWDKLSIYNIPGINEETVDNVIGWGEELYGKMPKADLGVGKSALDKAAEDAGLGKKDKDKKDIDKNKKDKLPSGIDPDPDAKHWEDVAEKRKINKGQYQKLIENQIASGGKSSYGDDKTLKDRTAEIEKMMHDMGIYDSKEDERAAKVADRIEREEARSAWNAVTMAGLSMMQGDSQFALTNIGKGIEDGISAYEKSEQKIADLEDKKLELAEKKATRDRDKKIAALTLAVQIEKDNQTNLTNLLTASADLESKANIALLNNETKKLVAGTNYNARVKSALISYSKVNLSTWSNDYDAQYPHGFKDQNTGKVYDKTSPEYQRLKNMAWQKVLDNVANENITYDEAGSFIESTD